MLDFDSVLQEIGEFGRYQKLVVVLLCIPACLMNAYNGFALVFLAYTPDHECVVNAATDGDGYTLHHANRTKHPPFVDEDTQCRYRMDNSSATWLPCDQFVFNKTYFDRTLITEWTLICDYALQPKLALSIFGVLSVTGCLILSIIQDRFGRKCALMLCVTLYIAGSSLSLLMPTFWAFCLARSICQLPMLAAWNTGYVMAMEFVGPSKRTLVSTVFCVVYALSTVSLAGIGYLTREWRTMGWVITAPFVVLYSYIWLVKESPRWLLSEGKVDEAKAVIQHMIRFEGKKFDSKKLDEILASAQSATENTTSSSPSSARSACGRATMCDLFRGRNLRNKTIIITFCWIANAVVYYSIAYNVENIGGNFFGTYALQAFMEAPAVLLNLVILNRVGRIWPLWCSMVLSGVACLLTAVELGEAWTIVLAILGKFGICISYAIVCQLAAELYPTELRGVGTGFSSVIGDMGNILMPYIVHSAEHYRALPMVILGILGLVSGMLALLLPETLGQYMPETCAEAELHGIVGRQAFYDHLARLKRWRHCGRKGPPVALLAANGHALGDAANEPLSGL